MKKKLFYDQKTAAWLMCAPAMATLLIFVVIPFFMSFVYSFTNKQFVMGVNNPLRFVGLENYKRVLTSGDMIAAAKNTVKYTVYVVPALTILPLLLALLLNNRLKGMTIYRVICFSPQVISMAVCIHCLGIYSGLISQQHDEYHYGSFRHFASRMAERPKPVSVFDCSNEHLVCYWI